MKKSRIIRAIKKANTDLIKKYDMVSFSDEKGKTYGEGLYQHILDNTYPKGKEGKQKIYYVSKTTGKEVEIGTDTHRTAGPSSKVAGQHSPHMQNKFIEADKG